MNLIVLWLITWSHRGWRMVALVGSVCAAWIWVLAVPSSMTSAVASASIDARLSIGLDAQTGVVLGCEAARFAGFRIQQSTNFQAWFDAGISLCPARPTLAWGTPELNRLFFRLSPEPPLILSALAADATTIRLNWMPIPEATEYRVYRDGAAVGSTAGRTGFYLDAGLTPSTVFNYEIKAFNSAGQPLGTSPSRSFGTQSSSHIRTRYQVLALAFYPDGSNEGEMSHIRTYFRHRLDFIRQASVNSAVLTPYTGDIVCLRARPPTLFAGSFNIDYARLAVTAFPELGGYSIVDLVEKGDVDMVWVTAAPDGCNFHENALVGNQDINPNVTGEKWNPAPAKCSRSFFVNAYLADARSWDAYAHMVEGILTTMSDGYPANWPADFACQVYTKNRSDFTTAYPAHLRLFERFRLTDVWNGAGAYASSGNGNCGSSHYPPTARRDVSGRYDGNYAYYDLPTWQRYIDCSADDWLRFPEFTGARRKLNGYDFGGFNNYLENEASYAKAFGASPELHPSFRFGTDSYHLWWFFHLPHNRGVTNGKLNNWWPYLFDFNRFKGNAITYPVDGFPDTAAILTPVNGEYGTESESANLWGYWHSCSDFGPNGRATVADRTRTPDLVRSGRYALHVAVELESFQHEGRNDLVFPIGRNARWDMSQARAIRVAVKLIAGASQILGVNPLLRLCANGGNRIELVPVRNGVYANFLNDNRFRDADGWQIFEIPIAGSPDWEANVIGYLDPSLGPADRVTARQELKRRIVAEVNYIEVSIRSEGGRGNSLVYCVDDLEIVGAAASK